MTIGLDHIQIAIPEGVEDSCRAFWGDLIGLVEIEKPTALRARGGVWFELHGTELHLGVETPFTPARKAHPGFYVGDIQGFAERMKTAGHITNWDDNIKGRLRFFSEDPFGNRLEFLSKD